VELNWSTFVLEIVNFVVLVFILKRFLYRPVLDVIAQRRKAVEVRLQEAHHVQEEAEALKNQYDARLTQWQNEQQAAKDALAREIDDERTRRLAELASELDQEKQKTRVAEQRQFAERQRTTEQQALRQGAAFSSRLLGQACGPELEAQLLNMLVDLTQLSNEQIARLREQWGDPTRAIEVSSTFPLTSTQCDRLESALHSISGQSTPVHFNRDEALLAGLRVVIGAWVLAANVRDELQGFTELASVPH
jgi:F-type H+-transporting ATPase subunit b